MTCSTGKIMHATREEATEHLSRLLYANHLRNQSERSARLNVYPCDKCSAWHVGHSSLQIPTVYHYDTVAALNAMTDKIVLRPPPPLRMDRKFKRANSSRTLASYVGLEIREPLVWFTWNSSWDFSGAPHPGIFVGASAEERRGGLIRIGVPAHVAKLRWPDYLARNRGRLTRLTAQCGNPGEWLATDKLVLFSAVRSLDVWLRGAWVDVNSMSAEDIDSFLPLDR